MSHATQPQNLTLTPRDLVAWSLAERARRFALAETLSVGAWAMLSDSAYEAVGERFVRVTAVRGDKREVAPFLGRRDEPAVVASKDLTGVPAIGEGVGVGPGDGAVFCPQATVEPRMSVLQVKSDGVELKTLPVTGNPPYRRASYVGEPRRGPAPSRATLCLTCGFFVASPSTYSLNAEVGPNLDLATFYTVSSHADPCRPRDGGTVVDAWIDPSTSDGRRDAVLCDFAGGATLWIWRDCLVQNELAVNPIWEWSPTHGRHPPTDIVRRHDQDSPAHGLAPASPAPALPASKDPMSNDPNKLATHLQSITSAAPPIRGAVYMLTNTYGSRLASAKEAIRARWNEATLREYDVHEVLGELDDVAYGAYEVRTVSEVELPSHLSLHVAKVVAVGSGSERRFEVLAALLDPLPGALAVPDGGVRRSLVEHAKGAAGAVGGAAKDAVVAVKDVAVETAMRQVGAVAEVAAERTAVAVYEPLRNAIGGAAAAVMGKDPNAVAKSVVYQKGADAATVAGGRILARVLSKFAPTVARAISAGTDTLEAGLDRKQATKVVDAAAPVIETGLKAIGQAMVERLAPMLAAPASTPAIEEKTTTTPVDAKQGGAA